MYNIDKPQERRKATGTGGIPPENIRLRRTLTTEYLQLSLCYGVRDRMSIETAGLPGSAGGKAACFLRRVALPQAKTRTRTEKVCGGPEDRTWAVSKT